MMIECTQILCTVLTNNGIKTPVKSTMPNHPCTIWAGQSRSNWIWLRALVLALNKEFKFRFGKNKDYALATVARGLPLPPIEDICMTDFVQVVPESYKNPEDAVEAYRNFYISETAQRATWKKRTPPLWLDPSEE